MSHANSTGGVPARRAVSRWAWRLLRRDWRQHLLIVLLLTVSVAAAVGLACAASNIAPAAGRADYGNANHFFVLNDLDPSTLPAKLEAAKAHFGDIDAIGHRPVPVPGSVKQLDYRTQQPGGALGGPLLGLRAGRYPAADDEVAVTDWVTKTLDLGVGSTIDLDGVSRKIVGIVENPSNFDDEFVLLPYSQLSTSNYVRMLVNANEAQIQSFHPPGDGNRILSGRGDVPADLVAAIVVLVVSTVVLFLVALIAAASFTVIAQRRLPQMGMMSAVGATEKHLRLTMLATGTVTGIVAAVLGAVIGLLGWIASAARMGQAVGYRIDAMNIPWLLVVATVVLAVVAATGAAWWPGRTMSRIPPVVALSGRPPEPARLHRSALLSVVLLAGGVTCLLIGGRSSQAASKLQVVLVVGGTLAVLAGVLLIGPIAIRAVATLASRVPISARLALRDLSRYQARSGAALAAIALALGIPVAVVASTAAAENNLGLGNLASTQLMLHAPKPDGPLAPASASTTSQPAVDAIADALHAPAIELDVAVNANAQPQPGLGGIPSITLARHVDHGWNELAEVFVATPAVLDALGLTNDDISDKGLISSVGGSNVEILDFDRGRSVSRDNFKTFDAPHSMPDTYDSLPHALVDPTALAEHGWKAISSGRWLFKTNKPLTSAELTAARVIAAQYGFTIESRETPKTLANVRLGAVAVGMLLALGILAMTVGLIRSESTGELRTLTATGATSSTRRNITATTAGGLAGLGAILGIAGAYIALAAGHISNLTPLPTLDLLIIAIGMPLAAAVAGWLLAGREPAVLARRPIA